MFAAPADIDAVETPTSRNPFPQGPPCSPPACFIGSYPPVTRAGDVGPFFVNTYYLQDNRRKELVGPVPVRSA